MEPSKDWRAECLVQLEGEKLAKFLEGIRFSSTRQKVMDSEENCGKL